MSDDRPEENVQEAERRLVKPVFWKKEDNQKVNTPDEQENIADFRGLALFSRGSGGNEVAGNAQIIGRWLFVCRGIIDYRSLIVFTRIAMGGAVAAIDGDFFAFFAELGCAGEDNGGGCSFSGRPR